MSQNARSHLFAADKPGLQVIYDATTLNDLTACAKKYELSHLQGWTVREEKTDLEFGSAAGYGLEILVNALVSGQDADAALRTAVRAVLQETWNSETGTPKLGGFMDVWRCTGVTKYRNEKGNAAKCPWSHKGKWYVAPGPDQCSCGSPTETVSRWFPDNPAKDRMQAVRVCVWYSEELKSGTLRPLSLEDEDGVHRAMTEMNWQVPFMKIQGRVFTLTGNWDSVKQLGKSEETNPVEVFPADYKTTKYTLDDSHFASYSPGWQVDLYDLVAEQVLPPGLRELYGGVLIEGIQVGVGWVRFGSRTFKKEPEQRAELQRELAYWMTLAIEFNNLGYYPRNRSHCRLCQFKPVCGARPEDRAKVLRDGFVRSFWNPLTRTRELVKDETRPLEGGPPASEPLRGVGDLAGPEGTDLDRS